MTSDLYTARDTGGRNGGKKVSDDQLKALETSTNQVLTETGRKREREREREREKGKRMLLSTCINKFLTFVVW